MPRWTVTPMTNITPRAKSLPVQTERPPWRASADVQSSQSMWTMRHFDYKVLAFFSFILLGQTTASVLYVNGVLKQRFFIYGGQGQVATDIFTSTVSSKLQCSRVCSRNRTCSIFSVTKLSDTQSECRVAYGNTTWTPHATSRLYLGMSFFSPITAFLSIWFCHLFV